jgi:hypothetical protein
VGTSRRFTALWKLAKRTPKVIQLAVPMFRSLPTYRRASRIAVARWSWRWYPLVGSKAVMAMVAEPLGLILPEKTSRGSKVRPGLSVSGYRVYSYVKHTVNELQRYPPSLI